MTVAECVEELEEILSTRNFFPIHFANVDEPPTLEQLLEGCGRAAYDYLFGTPPTLIKLISDQLKTLKQMPQDWAFEVETNGQNDYLGGWYITKDENRKIVILGALPV